MENYKKMTDNLTDKTDNLTDKFVKLLKLDFGVCLALLLVVVAVYELGWLEMGGLVGNERLAFWLENVGILIMIALLPYALKRFSVVIQRKKQSLAYEQQLELYLRMSRVRLGILWFVCFYNIVLYYETLNSIGAFCALVAFLSMFFCIPGKQKMSDELQVNADKAA